MWRLQGSRFLLNTRGTCSIESRETLKMDGVFFEVMISLCDCENGIVELA